MTELYRLPVTVSTEFFVTPPCVAVIVTLVLLETLCVVTVKVALVEPAFTVTLPGTAAMAALLLERLTGVFADGALVKVTVP